MKRWPLRLRMATLLLLASLLPLALMATLDISQARERLIDAMEDLLRARGDQLVRELDEFNRGRLRSVERIARFPATTDLCHAGTRASFAAHESVAALLAVFPASDPTIRAAALLGLDGRVLAASDDQLPSGMANALAPAVRAAGRGASTVTELYVLREAAGEVPVVSYLAPMKGSDGQVACVALLVVRATALWHTMKTSNGLAGAGSFAVLFDEQGIRIGHTYSDDIVFHPGGALAPAVVERQIAERRFGARTRALLEDVRSFPEQFDRSRAASAPDGGVFRGFAPVNQTWNYGVARRFDTVPWTLFYMIPEAALNGQIARMALQRAGLALGLMAAAALVGWFIASGLLRRVHALGKATERIAAGELMARVSDTSQDELGDLGRAFDVMGQRIQDQAQSLQGARDDLEQRVAQRTADLTQAAESLRDEIVERQRAEAAIRESQQLLQAIVDNTSAVVYVKDLRGHYLMVNRRYLQLFNLRNEDVLGRRDDDLFPPEIASALREVDKRVAAVQTQVVEEEVVPEADGLHTYISVKCPLRDADGQVRGIFGISTDITDRKQAELRLQAQLHRLNLLDQITRAIGERLDLQSIYQVVVRSLEERLPVDFCCVCRYDELEQSLTVISVGIRSAALATDLAMNENAGVPIDENGLSRCVRGHLVYEEDIAALDFSFPRRLARSGLRSLVIAPLQSESSVFGVLVVARSEAKSFSSSDCEFLRQLSAHAALAARQAELHASLQRAYDDLRLTQQSAMQQERLRALGQMASGIAHDINNAISPVMLYTENLLEREPLSPQARNALQTIARAIDDVAATVARMREFYRLRDAELVMAPVPLNALVEQIVELTRARWSDMPLQRGAVIQLQTELAPQLPAALGVESEIREALINLVFNAVDAMPEGGELTLRTLAFVDGSGPRAQLEVTDTGQGMDDETRRRCMEPFFTTKGERGTGLGLAMVYGAAKRHGAEIDVRSTVGQGTTVVMRFPAVPDPAAGIAVMEPAAQVLPRRARLLVIDDDPLLLRSLQETLEQDGHVVETASGGQAGIDAFRRAQACGEPHELVITDLGMPYVDGRKVATAVKQASVATPVLMLTGWGQRIMVESDLPAGVDQVLSKPPKLRELRQALLLHLQER